MEERIRQILQEQMSMKGQGDMANRRAAGRNPWINYLKDLEMDTGIPYNELMVDPSVKEEYDILKGSGALVGGIGPTCWTKFRHLNAGKKFLKKDNPNMDRHYKNYLKKTGCVNGKISRKKTVAKSKTAPKKRKTTRKI